MRVIPLTPSQPLVVRDELVRRGFDPARADSWTTAQGAVPLDEPCVVGILNITPDSFSDGGRYSNLDDAVRHAEAMLAAGARVIDVGGESTRPGTMRPLSAHEEWTRLEPVIREVVRRFPAVPLSVDTVKAETARRALGAGAWIVNDVSGLRHDPEIASLCADHGAGLVLMHSRGDFGDLASYRHAQYADVVTAVMDELQSSVAIAESRGLTRSHLVLDPGLGFSKEPRHNYAILNRLDGLTALGFPVMVGPSRKRFLGHTTRRDVGARDNATVAVCVAAFLAGARLFRVHAVEPVVEALAVAGAIRGA